MRILAIGDIHGCSQALHVLLDRVEPTPDDLVITLGDYVDRGPDSFGVIEQLLALHRTGRLVALRGNHEEMMLSARNRALDPTGWLACGGASTLQSYAADGGSGKLEDVPAAHWDFLENVCVEWYETDSHIFVHGNVNPDVPMNEQLGLMLRWGAINRSNSLPHCSGKVVVCGHTQQRSGLPLNLGHAVCIDTAAYANGWLTCLDVTTGLMRQANKSGRVRNLWLSEIGADDSSEEA